MLNRRDMLMAGFGAALVAGVAPAALARAPLAAQQIVGVARRKVGTIQVTALLDGYAPLAAEAFSGADQAEIKAILARSGFGTALPTSVNAFVVNTGEKTYLVDSGTGSSMAFGPNLGRMRDNLRLAGIEPRQIDAVILSHAHTDHAEGLLTPSGAARFPNAEIILSEVEANFWTDDGNLSRAPAAAKPLFESARKSLKPYAGRIRKAKSGEIAPGIALEASPGHTPGHSIVRVTSGRDQLLIIADTLHNAAIHLARPDIGFAFDSDAAQAAQSRRRVFDMVSADNMLVAATHVAFPSFGRIVKDGDAYRYVAADGNA